MEKITQLQNASTMSLPEGAAQQARNPENTTCIEVTYSACLH